MLAPVSLLLVGVAAEAGHLLGVPWTLLSPLVLGAVVGAALWPLGRGRAPVRRPRARGATAQSPTPQPDAAVPAPAPTRVERSFRRPARPRHRDLTGLVIGGGVILTRR